MHLYFITIPDGTASVVANNLHEAYAIAYATYIVSLKTTRHRVIDILTSISHGS